MIDREALIYKLWVKEVLGAHKRLKTASGGYGANPKLVKQHLKEKPPKSAAHRKLTKVQQRFLKLHDRGFTTQEIAKEMGVHVRTVYNFTKDKKRLQERYDNMQLEAV